MILCFLIFLLNIIYILNIEKYTSESIVTPVKIQNDKDLTFDFPIDKNYAIGLCDNSCIKLVDQEFPNINKNIIWKPFGYWNGNWIEQKYFTNNKAKYKLYCGCNIEF